MGDAAFRAFLLHFAHFCTTLHHSRATIIQFKEKIIKGERANFLEIYQFSRLFVSIFAKNQPLLPVRPLLFTFITIISIYFHFRRRSNSDIRHAPHSAYLPHFAPRSPAQRSECACVGRLPCGFLVRKRSVPSALRLKGIRGYR